MVHARLVVVLFVHGQRLGWNLAPGIAAVEQAGRLAAEAAPRPRGRVVRAVGFEAADKDVGVGGERVGAEAGKGVALEAVGAQAVVAGRLKGGQCRRVHGGMLERMRRRKMQEGKVKYINN